MNRLSRRETIKRAVAIGGAAALSACLDVEGPPDLERGPPDPSVLPDRQHAWNEVLSRDDHGNVVMPRHHVVLLLEYDSAGPPVAKDRDTLESTLRSLDRAYRRGNEGLLFTIGYTPRYFDRFDASLPSTVDLPAPTALAPFEDPELDTPDAMLHLASDYGQVVLAAEDAVMGLRDTLNGIEFETSFEELFGVSDRRTGFVGDGLPADNQDVTGIPDSNPVDEDAPLYMGFKSGFRKNQATEDRVTIRTGRFAGGTTQHLSHVRLNLGQWYTQDSRAQRVAKMFCPVHAAEGRVEGVGDNLGDESEIDDCIDTLHDDARSSGIVGHSQKTAQARSEDSPVILRRDFDTTDDDRAGLHFLALQRSIEDFVATREAMNGREVARNSAVGERTNNGILQYLSVQRRGNYLIPPRPLRAFPRPVSS